MPVALTAVPSQSSTRRRMYKTKRVKFGNGYTQSAPDGINDMQDEWTLVFENLTLTERNALVTALDSVEGWDYLTWQAPGDNTTKRWLVTDGWSESTTGNAWTITVNLEQTY